MAEAEEDLKKFAGVLAGSLERGLEKLKGIVPERGVVDPERWLKVHRPELLKDADVATCMAVWKLQDKGKTVRKFLRKKSRVSYKITFDREEAITLQRLLQDAVINYETNYFYINMAKGIIKDYFDYAIFEENVLHLSSAHLGMIFKAFTVYLSDMMTAEYIDEEDKLAVLKLLKSVLTKKMIKHRSVTIPSLNEDGTVGEFKFDREKVETSVAKFVKGKIKLPEKERENEL